MKILSTFVTLLVMCIAFYYSHFKMSVSVDSEKIPLHVLIGIMSSRSHFEHRMAIRSSWLNKTILSNQVDGLFILGRETCHLPPEDRSDSHSCTFWNVDIPETNSTQWSGKIGNSSLKTRVINLGFTIQLRHPIVITRLGVFERVLNINNSVVVVLLNSISQEVIAKTQFDPDKQGVLIAGYYYLPIQPVILPKDFEASIILEVHTVSEMFSSVEQSWNSARGLFSFKHIIEHNYQHVKWNEDVLSAVSFGFLIHDFTALKDHVMKFDNRQMKWRNRLQQEETDIQDEMVKFKDIVIVNSVDYYRNLPLKLIQFFKWADAHYAMRFILKTDDDVMLDLPTILRELDGVESTVLFRKKLWWSRFRFNWIVDLFGKWTELNYISVSYPPFACGLGSVVSSDIVNWVAKNSDELQTYQGEDVSLGIWLAAIGPTYKHDERWQCDSGCVNGSYNMGQLAPVEILNAWNSLQECSNMCGCDKETET